MKEKNLIFMFTNSRYDYYTLMQDICYHMYESVIKELTDFTCERFRLNQYWEKERIRSLLYEKTEVCCHCDFDALGFAIISGNLLNSNNILDFYDASVSDLRCNYLIYSRRYDGTIHIYAYKGRNRSCYLNTFFDTEYHLECDDPKCLKDYFDIVENDLKLSAKIMRCTEMENELSRIFKLPISDDRYDEFVKKSGKHELFGVGGHFDSNSENDQERLDWLEDLDTVSPNALIYSEVGFKIDKNITDYASLHIISDKEDMVKSSVTCFNSCSILPDRDKMNFYEKEKLDYVFSVLGDNFYNEIKKGTPLSNSLKKRKIYCIKGNSDVFSLYSNAFFYDSIEDQIEIYFSGYKPSYVIVFGYNEDEKMFIKLFVESNSPLSEIFIYSNTFPKRNIWKNLKYLCNILKCDEQKIRKAVDKSDLKKTCVRISEITGIPFNLSYETVANNPQLYDAKRWN